MIYLCGLNLALSEDGVLVRVQTRHRVGVLQRRRGNGLLRRGFPVRDRHTVAMAMETVRLHVRGLCMVESHAHHLSSCFVQEIPRIFLPLFQRR